MPEPRAPADLAALIRELDGDHSMGAGELAELLEFRGVRVVPEGAVVVSRTVLAAAMGYVAWHAMKREQPEVSEPARKVEEALRAALRQAGEK